MFQFEHLEFRWALAALPLLLTVFFLFLSWRKKAMARLGEARLVGALMPDFSKYKHSIKFGLLLLALAFLVVGWMNPQWGTKQEKAKRKSVDVIIALDISTSMLAEDIPPSRLERAKRFAEDLAERIKSENIGIVLFAGSAYLQTPITDDIAAAKVVFRSANPDQAGTQGTVIGEAIDRARRSFRQEDESHKALIVITDGEDHDVNAIEQAQGARDDGIFIFTIGVGTPEGSFIPVTIGGRSDYKRDRNGEPVRSRLNEEALAEIAKAGDGDYFNIANGEAVIDALQKRIDQMEKRELEVRSFTSYNSYFQYFLGVAALLLLIEFLISYRKEKWMEGKDIFS